MKYIEQDAWQSLCEAILSLQNEEDCRHFFEDLCTIKEVQDMAQRYRVALMLDEGKNYQEICRATGASTATICRVNKCLQYGEGYRAVLKREASRAKENE